MVLDTVKNNNQTHAFMAGNKAEKDGEKSCPYSDPLLAGAWQKGFDLSIEARMERMAREQREAAAPKYWWDQW